MNRHPRSMAWALALLLLLAAVSPQAQATDPSERALDSAVARQKSYDDYYVFSNDLVRAQTELKTALAEYSAGARRYPRQRGFNFGLGILHNIRGEYEPAIQAFRRELRILDTINDKSLDRDRLIACSGLAEAYEGIFDYSRALRHYADALTYDPDDPATRDAIERCRHMKDSFRDLSALIASANVPDGTAVDVVYSQGPTTYLEPVRIEYRIEMRGQRIHLRLTVPVAYKGEAANRETVESRMRKIAARVEECFARSGLSLRLAFTFVEPDRLSPSRGVTVWDHYVPPDRRIGDARNWAILSTARLELTPEMAASTVAHEVGHMLGLGHPPYYPEKPYADIMTAGYPWAGITGKRVFPDDVKFIIRPLLAPPDTLGVLKHADDLLMAGKAADAVPSLDAARRRCPDNTVFHLAFANAAFDAGDYPKAVDGYTEALKATPQDDQKLLLRGITRARMKDYRNAILDFTRIVAQPSGGVHAAAYCERANVYELMGDKAREKADRDRSDAALANPVPDPEARKTLGLPPWPPNPKD